MQGGGGASRTFQSIFGSSGGSDRSVDGKPTETSTGATSELLDRIRTIQQSQRHESDEDAWGEDDEDGLPVVDADHNQTNSAGHARSIADWADHDDDEDGWKDALQSRVDQLELVVERAVPDSQTATTALHSSNCPPVATAMSVDGPTEYVAPVDQRATLTLVPKTTLARSISDPITANESKPATSKLKAPTAVTGGPRPGSGVRATSTAAYKGVDTSGKPTDTVEPRKRSNSRDYLTRQPLAADHKSTASNKAASGSNTNLVRAVVARGNVNVRNQEAKPSIDEHMDKRTRADDHNAVLSLSDAETARRYILSDVKKMSVERIVADAKRLHYLEELYRRHPAVTDAHDTSRDTTRSDGTRPTPSTKKRAI